MANIGPTPLGGGTVRWSVDTTAVIPLELPENVTGCSWYIQVKTGGATPGSFIIKQTVAGSGYTGSDLCTPIFTTTDSSTPTAGGTAISTGGKTYIVIADGQMTYLDYTGGADGMVITARGVAS